MTDSKKGQSTKKKVNRGSINLTFSFETGTTKTNVFALVQPPNIKVVLTMRGL